MMPAGRALARSLVLYMLAELPKNKIEEISVKYGRAMGSNEKVLPTQIYTYE